jgi:hypothetical protein
MKFCYKCNIVKDLDQFYCKKSSKDGYDTICKRCCGEQKKQYAKINKEKIVKYRKTHYEDNKERICERQRQYNKENKELRAEGNKKYRKDNPEYDKRRIEKIQKTGMCISHPLIKAIDKNFCSDCSLKNNLRRRISIALKSKGGKKNTKTQEILGASLEIVKLHIEKQFEPGMTWENHGPKTWHIDHKIPLASAKDGEELLNICHYTNLQPLWAKDNLRKHDKSSKEWEEYKMSIETKVDLANE